MKRRIYLTGPMSGKPEHNFPAFDLAARKLRQCGWHVFNPAEMDRIDGLDEFDNLPQPVPREIRRQVMTRDVLAVLHSDAIAILPLWENSRGVAVELALAKFLGLPEIYLPDPSLNWMHWHECPHMKPENVCES